MEEQIQMPAKQFYDLHVHTDLSIGENSVDEVCEFAKKLGLHGIGIARYYNGSIEELQKRSDIDIVPVIMIKPSSAEELNKIANKVRKKADVLMVHGGDFEINRAACENSMIDILCHPELGRKDSGFDHVCAKLAAENKVAIEINFREILESSKTARLHVFSSMKKNIMLCKSYGTDVITTSGSVSKWNMRSGREMAAMANLLGLELPEAVATVSDVPARMVQTNREKLAGRRWEGVNIVGD